MSFPLFPLSCRLAAWVLCSVTDNYLGFKLLGKCFYELGDYEFSRFPKLAKKPFATPCKFSKHSWGGGEIFVDEILLACSNLCLFVLVFDHSSWTI